MKPFWRHHFSRLRDLVGRQPLVLGVVGVLWLVGVWFYLHTLQWRSDGWYLGHGNVWSDWSLHISQVTRMAFTNPSEWWQSTYFAGAKFTYPFASNLLSAVLIRLGASYQLAMIGPSIVFWTLTLGIMLWFGSWLLRSVKQTVLAMTIFFASAGLGWLRLFAEKNWLRELWNPTQDYTQFGQYQWGTGNLFLGMFLPQRAFLFGFWVALLAWGLWLRSLEQKKNWRVLAMAAGILAGLLPIIHMHSFMVIALLSVPIALHFYKGKWQPIMLFAGVSAAVSIPLYLLFIAGGIESSNFFQWRPGWTARGVLDWVNQWIWQWGFMLPLAAVALWWLRERVDRLRWLALVSFSLVFVVANFIQFQPVAWDNTKFFLWVYWGFSLTVAGLLAHWWRRSSVTRAAAVFMIIALCGTGFVELLRSAQIEKYTYQATSAEAYALAVHVRETTQPNEIFATAPVHNHWVTMWAGRPIVMGYSTWVWNFGYDLGSREQDLSTLYQQSDQRQAIIEKYNISYIVVGIDESIIYGETDFSEFPVAYQTEEWTVYKTRL